MTLEQALERLRVLAPSLTVSGEDMMPDETDGIQIISIPCPDGVAETMVYTNGGADNKASLLDEQFDVLEGWVRDQLNGKNEEG